MTAYLDQTGEPSDAPGRFVRVDEVQALHLVDGMVFRPITTDSVMANFVSIEPNADLAIHHHVEQQISIIISGELTLTVGGETQTLHAGECAVIPPHVPHGGTCGPEGALAIDVFTPPRAGIVQAMA